MNPTVKSGSRWHRWDPHLHTPLTTLNNQFGSASFEDFCSSVEGASPTISALGITDYYSLRGYREVTGLKRVGRLPGVDLIFPNVEIRFSLGTVKGSPINAHLLFCPDDADHVAQIERFLSRLCFTYISDEYYCTEADLIRLGRKINPSAVTDEAALKEGANQFKVDFKGLQEEFAKNEWARKNCLIGVASGQGDGTSGLRTVDGGFQALRTTIEASAHLIFSGNAKDCDFWLGRGADSERDIERKYRGLKPCLHGSDAHEIAKVGCPDLDRFCWVKGDPTFESLRQACIEPTDRVQVASEAPRGSLAGQTIESVAVTNAGWMRPAQIRLNPGLVAIIGARGSGKTALADVVAAAGLGVDEKLNDRSFLARASGFLARSRAELAWESGEITGTELTDLDTSGAFDLPRVQYLSQQFVDALCSSEGVTDKLAEEVKRVIFEAHGIQDREGSSDFDGLYELRCRDAIERRGRSEEELDGVANDLMQERLLKQEGPGLAKQRAEIEEQVKKSIADRDKLVRPGQEERLKRLQAVSFTLQARRGELEASQKENRALASLRGDLEDFRSRRASQFLAELRESRAAASLSDAEWETLRPVIPDAVDKMIADKAEAAEKKVAEIAGKPVPAPSAESVATALIAGDADLKACSVMLLQAEADRLTQLIGIDKQNSLRYKASNEKITASQKAVANLNARIDRCGKAEARINELIGHRRLAYREVFEAIQALENELGSLYGPLERSLEGSEGALGRLKFVIRRKVDVDAWVARGESLLDLRKNGPFQGKGSLKLIAQESLERVWSIGTPEEVSVAINDFINANADRIKTHRLESMEQREWNAQISRWLHSTEHLSVEYGLQYDGVDIERLSPGTRGIVLLLLYLEIDKNDDRPLIIDQPEENLDPQSVYDELVPRFRSARNRRQIIIVTHNANLVVNTDVDQVIVASAGQHQPGSLPEINYKAGGLEDPEIRQLVCDILEGGERAFEARAKRLRVAFAS